jgi:hypothetical protein
MAESLDIEEMRATLARVSIYRRVCDSVRAGAGHTLFNGFFFLGIAYLNYNFMGNKFHPFLLGPIIIGSLEIAVGLWKRFKPSPECVLMDALLQAGFVLSIVIREYVLIQDGQIARPRTFSIVIGLWVGWEAFNTFNAYMHLRRVFTERPTSEHIAYVEDLSREIETARPESDPTALDVPTKPQLQIKMMGDIALVLETSSRELFLCARRELDLTPEARGDLVRLVILREEYPPCPIDLDSWRNYANWKTAGGEPTPTVR